MSTECTCSNVPKMNSSSLFIFIEVVHRDPTVSDVEFVAFTVSILTRRCILLKLHKNSLAYLFQMKQYAEGRNLSRHRVEEESICDNNDTPDAEYNFSKEDFK
jgi:hypothetical protein